METIEREGLAVEFVSRVQLRAIFSGLAVAIGVLAVCLGFSWAIGLSTFQPTADHARGLALGNIIWGAIAIWISLFFGAWMAAIVGRSPDARSGILHGLVVWGALAAFLGAAVVMLFGGFLPALVRLGGGELPTAVQTGAGANARAALGMVAQAAGLTVWLYWAGIVGGLITSVIGGLLGARTEGTERRRIGVRVPPPTTGVPQPA